MATKFGRANTGNRSRCAAVALALVPAAWSSIAAADAAPDLAAALTTGTTSLDLRLRYESVDQDNPALKEADAVTLRTALGYTTKPYQNLTAFVELENVSAVVDDYAPAHPGYSIVADPEGAEVNQWGVRYAGIAGLTATLGRSKLILDNARWVGNVGWRQNEQTFDGVFLKYAASPTVSLQYAYLSNVNTITATNVDLDGHVLNASWTYSPALALTGYGYWLDYAADTATDFDTVGLRASGSVPMSSFKLVYSAEYASQDAETASADFSADYVLGEVGIVLAPVTIKLGYEQLGSDDGQFGLQTPLATKHAFNGWADMFLNTPSAGLEDTYVSVSGKALKAAWVLVYHQFDANEGSAAFGDEWDAQVTLPVSDKLSAGIKYATYAADELAVDTDKLWVWAQFKF